MINDELMEENGHITTGDHDTNCWCKWGFKERPTQWTAIINGYITMYMTTRFEILPRKE